MMKPRWKRILTLMLALLLSVSWLHTAALAAEEASYEHTDSYVINYAKTDLGTYTAQAPYLYASPHFGNVRIRNLDTGNMVSWITSQQVYNLINTTKLAQGGEGAYASIEAYCTDACSDAVDGSGYRRINLEDSTYFDDVTAQRLRAVFLSSFPYIKDFNVITDAVNTWITETGAQYDSVDSLTGAEAITATQIAIWSIANGSDVSVNSAYYDTDPYTEESLAGEVVFIQDSYVNCMEDASEYTANNIKALYAFLLDQEGIAATENQIAVSDDAISVKDVTFVPEEGGTYTATVEVTINASINDSDALILTAMAEEQMQSVALVNGNTDYTLTLSGLTQIDRIYLEINGTQTVADVFLFDSTGNRSVSQSMIAYDDSTLPVHAEAVAEPDRIMNFHKTTDTESGMIPLENIVFDIYKAADLQDYLDGTAILPEAPTAEYAAESLELVTTLITGTDGKASCNLTELGYDDCIYLVVERDSAAIVSPAAPFYVSLPMSNEQGDGWIYQIDIQPKNQVVEGPEIDKDITEIDNDEDSFHVGQTHTWIIRSDIPEDIVDAQLYKICDTLDYRLTFSGNLTFCIAQKASYAHTENIVLENNTDYILSTGKTEDASGNSVDTFSVSLTQTGMEKIAQNVDVFTDCELRIYFDASINSYASLGTEIPNQATLDYTNSVGFDYTAESDEPVVYTGGLSILKYDAYNSEKYLSGAVFKLARLATDNEIEAGISDKLTVNGSSIAVVFESFYTDSALSVRADQVATDTNGIARLYGLAYGEYYLVEVQAPEGYNLLSGPVAVTINENTHQEDLAIRVANSSEFQLPATGDQGIAVYMIVGTLVLLAGCSMFLLRKRIVQ